VKRSGMSPGEGIGGVGKLDSKGVEAVEISCIGSSLSSPIVTCLVYDSHVQH
jgi:hypothetical protein